MSRKKAGSDLKKRGTYHHGNLREALLEAAVRRIAQSHEFDFRLRDLAEDCGVRLAACYRHFSAKSDVLVELARRGFVDLGAALAAVPQTEAPACVLSSLGVAYMMFAQQNPVQYLAMFHPALSRSHHPELDATALHTLLQLRAAVTRALGTKVNARRVDRAVFRAWSAVHGYASLLVFRDSETSRPLFAQAATSAAIKSYAETTTHAVLAA